MKYAIFICLSRVRVPSTHYRLWDVTLSKRHLVKNRRFAKKQARTELLLWQSDAMVKWRFGEVPFRSDASVAKWQTIFSIFPNWIASTCLTRLFRFCLSDFWKSSVQKMKLYKNNYQTRPKFDHFARKYLDHQRDSRK